LDPLGEKNEKEGVGFQKGGRERRGGGEKRTRNRNFLGRNRDLRIPWGIKKKKTQKGKPPWRRDSEKSKSAQTRFAALNDQPCQPKQENKRWSARGNNGETQKRGCRKDKELDGKMEGGLPDCSGPAREKEGKLKNGREGKQRKKNTFC